MVAVNQRVLGSSPRGGATYKEFHESETLFFIYLPMGEKFTGRRWVYPALAAGSSSLPAEARRQRIKSFTKVKLFFFYLPMGEKFIPHLLREAQEEEQRIKSFTKVKLFFLFAYGREVYRPKVGLSRTCCQKPKFTHRRWEE